MVSTSCTRARGSNLGLANCDPPTATNYQRYLSVRESIYLTKSRSRRGASERMETGPPAAPSRAAP
eukprot:scaffold2425_cov76-Skeletonema_dohrnii-CCMP3373.AAC.1